MTKTICIHKNGKWWSFLFEEGQEEQLLQTMLGRTCDQQSVFSVEDVIAIVQSCPALFAKAA
jgi:hypothetical protein